MNMRRYSSDLKVWGTFLVTLTLCSDGGIDPLTYLSQVVYVYVFHGGSELLLVQYENAA